ncbi:MAG: hypothetical protein PT941_02410 [Bacillales bacterium]|nr:hypothetical protein [Bacillales bacterium]
MKLLSLHINAYGKFSDYEYSFDNFNAFCEDNGYGKSTICSFIKAMFYGLESVYSNSTYFCDRKHFFPFKGGNFGGSITFEFKNKIYRIERSFHKKSYTKDTMIVYCNNSYTNELREIPGITLFGINKESFERLLFITPEKIEINTNNDINKKLNNYIENVNENFNIDVVDKKIKDKKKNYKNQLKITKESISSINEEIMNLEMLKQDLDTKYKKLSLAEEEKNLSIEEYKKASILASVFEKWNSLDKIGEKCTSLNNQINHIKENYPLNLPSIECVNGIKEDLEQIKISKSSLEKVISLEQENEYERLKEKYSKHLPTNDEIEKIDEKISTFDSLIKEKENLSQTNLKRKEELDKHFGSETINEDEITLFEEQMERLKILENQIKEIPTKVNEVKRADNKKYVNRPVLLSIFLFGLGLLAGGIYLFFYKIYIAIILTSLGVLALGLGLFIIFINMTNKNNEIHIEKDNSVYLDKLNEIKDQKNVIINHFAYYRYSGDSLDVMLYQIKNDAKAYSELLNQKEADLAKINDINSKIDIVKEELDHFFFSVSMKELSYKKALDIVKKDLVRLDTLTKLIFSNQEKREELEKNKIISQERVESFYSSYQIDRSRSIDLIYQDILDLSRLEKEYEEEQTSYKKYKEINHLEERVENVSFDLEELENNMNIKNNYYSMIKVDIENIEEEITLLEESKIELARKKELKKEYEQKILLLDALKEEIYKADQRLKDKYISPVKEKFCEYANLLEKTLGVNVEMDKDFKISFEKEGALRRSNHLSSGNLTLCALCFRLALLDNMFEDDLPFLILDDPFTSLDAKHLENAKELINKLSENKQILYFTCHESRKIN